MLEVIVQPPPQERNSSWFREQQLNIQVYESHDPKWKLTDSQTLLRPQHTLLPNWHMCRWRDHRRDMTAPQRQLGVVTRQMFSFSASTVFQRCCQLLALNQ